MARNNGHGKLSNKKLKSKPEIYLDKDHDFASIKLTNGIEAKSYQKDGFVFLEDKKGKIIEIQILNLSQIRNQLKNTA
ncbi:MAG: DUF2283 domain-containing protein [Bdellovibrionota bacterium]